MNDEELQEVVLKAVVELNDGRTETFNSLIHELNKKSIDEALFCMYIHALRKAIQHMNKQHETLVGVILNIDWAGYNVDSVQQFIEFLGELVSAKTYYVKVCIRSLIKQFAPRTEFFDDLLVAFKRKCDHIHSAIQTIVHIVPLSSKYVAEIVSNLFPYTGKSLFVLETYIVNILQITVYVTQTRYEILALLIDKLMSIDVHILRHELEKEESNVQYQLDISDSSENSAHVNPNACKLDQLMAILFAYIDSISFIDGNLDYIHAELLVKDLMRIYEEVMLKTQNSSHVQFLIFYVASFHKNFWESFLETCWRILEDPNYASILRQTCACYLSSFLARAKYIEKDVIKGQLKRISEWIHRYIDFLDDSNIRAEKSRHGPFYSTCQALFYVFSYHYKILLDSSSDIQFIKSINFDRIVFSRLNPLKFCLDSVVNIFARITRMYEIVFCYSVIERNNRLLSELQNFPRLDSSVSVDCIGNYFPFDPYILPKSGKWITSIYIQWNEPGGGEDLDDESGNSSVGSSDNEGGAEEVALSVASWKLETMSISPGFYILDSNISKS